MTKKRDIKGTLTVLGWSVILSSILVVTYNFYILATAVNSTKGLIVPFSVWLMGLTLLVAREEVRS